MPRIIAAIHEFWTDGIADMGGSSRDVNFHFKAQFDDGAIEWHYYGTPLPDPLPAGTYVLHPAIHFPLDFNNMPEVNALMFDLAHDVARYLLQI